MLKVSSLFSQIPAEIPRRDFEKPGAKQGTEGHAKGFRSWTRFEPSFSVIRQGIASFRGIGHGLFPFG